MLKEMNRQTVGILPFTVCTTTSKQNNCVILKDTTVSFTLYVISLIEISIHLEIGMGNTIS